jgi:hypothetical protein
VGSAGKGWNRSSEANLLRKANHRPSAGRASSVKSADITAPERKNVKRIFSKPRQFSTGLSGEKTLEGGGYEGADLGNALDRGEWV